MRELREARKREVRERERAGQIKALFPSEKEW
jgi:hypothetical protein